MRYTKAYQGRVKSELPIMFLDAGRTVISIHDVVHGGADISLTSAGTGTHARPFGYLHAS